MPEGLLKIEDQERILLEAIRIYCRQFLANWQIIPGLAWQIIELMDEKQDDEAVYDLLYPTCNFGLWPIAIRRERWYADLWVDCATGNLVDAEEPRKEASTETLRLLYGNIHLIDPFLIGERLMGVKMVDAKFRTPGKNLHVPNWVSDLRSIGGVPASYSRKEELPIKVNTQLVPDT